MLGLIRKFATIAGTIGIFVGGFMLVVLMGSMRPKVTPKEVELTPPAVFYEVVKSQSATLDVLAQGEVRPRTDINLTAEVAGRIEKTSPAFVAGGAFEKGDLLLKIHDADYRVAVTASKARVAQADELLRREEAESELARKDYEALGRAQEAGDLTLRKPQLAQARAAYDAARADHAAALLNLDRTEIRAPFKGRVRERIAGEGQFIAPGAPIGRIFSTDVAEVRLPLTDSDLAKLGMSIAFVESPQSPGPEALLSATVAGVAHEWRARIARTDGSIDPGTRLVGAIAVVDDPYGAGADDGAPLAVGLFVDARIRGKEIPDAIVLPRTALYGRDTVYVIGKDGRIAATQVAIVSDERENITIAGGLADGDRVVISPLRGAKDGDEVTPTEREDFEKASPTAEDASETAASSTRQGAVQ